jgi:PAS domain S-box-containing protein
MASLDRQKHRTAARGGIAGLRRYTVLFAVALVALGFAELALFAGQRMVQVWQDHSRLVGEVARDAYALTLERRSWAHERLNAGPGRETAPGRADGALLDSTLRTLSALTADNAEQESRVRQIAAAVRSWNSAFVAPAVAGTLDLRNASQADAATFGPVRTVFAQFLTAEDVLYDSRRDYNLLLGLLALAAMLVPGGMLAALVVAAGRRFGGQADQLADQQDQLEEQAVELEQQVQELEVTNTELAETVVAEKHARDQAEFEVRERQRHAALLDAAMASSPIGLSLLDRDLRYIRVNHAIADITGISPAEHVGRTLREVNPALSPDIEAALFRVVETDQPLQNFEMMRNGSPAGETRHLLLNVYPVKTAAGESLGVGVAVVDTTEQRVLLAQFHHAQKLEAVGRLAAGVAHDFNNLLTVIRSYCDLALLEMPDGAQGREEIKEIRSAGERAAALSRQILALSRKQAILPRALPLGDALGDMESMLRRVTGDSVQLEVRLDDPLGTVHIDPTHLEQVLMNLVINAVDAMPDGGRVVIEAANAVVSEADAKPAIGIKAGDHAVIAVRDSGTGIDDETLQRIFDPFFTTKPQGKGTGLGLSTVYGIVRDAGGHVRVESALGHGTTFRVYLPAEFPRGLPELRHTPDAVHAPAMAREGETVLVVEDEDALRGTLVRILRRRGYVVLQAAHGGEALRVSQGHDGRIDLMLTDIHMPGMHGRDLVARIHVERPGLRVLFTSGSPSADGEDVRQIVSPYDFIAKPFTIDELAMAMRHALDTPTVA